MRVQGRTRGGIVVIALVLSGCGLLGDPSRSVVQAELEEYEPYVELLDFGMTSRRFQHPSADRPSYRVDVQGQARVLETIADRVTRGAAADRCGVTFQDYPPGAVAYEVFAEAGDIIDFAATMACSQEDDGAWDCYSAYRFDKIDPETGERFFGFPSSRFDDFETAARVGTPGFDAVCEAARR